PGEFAPAGAAVALTPRGASGPSTASRSPSPLRGEESVFPPRSLANGEVARRAGGVLRRFPGMRGVPPGRPAAGEGAERPGLRPESIELTVSAKAGAPRGSLGRSFR